MEAFKLPKNFMLGTATASLQIEGGDKNNNRYKWAEEGHIKGGTHCIVANDHWNRVDEDIPLIKELNSDTYRMGIEWSRIEPKRGEFSYEALDHYRQELIKLREAGIVPLVTLHHFSNPLWLEEEGAWINPKVIDYFERYTEYVLMHLGDLVSDFITINEPNVYLTQGYLFGIWPPGKNNLGEYLKGAKNMILAHIKAYLKIHSIREKLGFKDTKVGVANHLRVFDPKHNSFFERIVCRMYNHLIQELFVAGMTEGKLLFPLGAGYPLGKGKYFDFFGVNYYTRDIVALSLTPLSLFGKIQVKEDSIKNDLGWEIYPEGLYRMCKNYYNRLKSPIYITENGTCDSKDAFRAQYIYDHLFQVRRLIEEGVEVQRYYHWSLMDNFEWVEGLTPRFGLIEMDYNTLGRKIRRSGKFYSDICKFKEVSDDMIRKYF